MDVSVGKERIVGGGGWLESYLGHGVWMEHQVGINVLVL